MTFISTPALGPRRHAHYMIILHIIIMDSKDIKPRTIIQQLCIQRFVSFIIHGVDCFFFSNFVWPSQIIPKESNENLSHLDLLIRVKMLEQNM